MSRGRIGTIAAVAAVTATLSLAGCASPRRTGPERPGRTPYLQAIDSDLAYAARGFADGWLTGREYLALSSDRAAKARRYRYDPGWRAAAAQGDGDEDRVPDSLDACVSSPFTPTDEKGCPPPVRPECTAGEGPCPGPDADDDRRTREILDHATLLVNPACDGSPPPRASGPLAWGHGRLETRNTFFFEVAKAGGRPPGCDLFYEMEFRIELLHQGPEPLVRYITVLFRDREDLTPLDPKRAVFGIPFGEAGRPARADLWGALMNAASVRWRVRAVDGAQAASSWSVMKLKSETAGGLPF